MSVLKSDELTLVLIRVRASVSIARKVVKTPPLSLGTHFKADTVEISVRR